MKRQNNPGQSQDFAMDRLLGGPPIVVDEADEYGVDIKPVKYCCHFKDHAIELQHKLRIANEQLAEFHELLEAHEALKKRNEELESYITQKQDKTLEKLTRLSLSLDESPFTRIIDLVEELKDVKLELALARSREDWLEQQLRQKKFGNDCSDPEEQQNQKLCPIGESSQELPSANANEEVNSMEFSGNSRHSSLQSNDQLKVSSGNIIKQLTSSNTFAIASCTRFHSEEGSTNASSGKNSNALPANTKSCLKSNEPMNTSRELPGLGKHTRQIVSSNNLSEASCNNANAGRGLFANAA